MKKAMELVITIICITMGAVIGIKIGFVIADFIIWIIEGL